MNPSEYFSDTVLLIDKPYRWTSFDVVKKVRNIIKVKKVGHAGTLDPLATGLLVLCTGKKTKDIEYVIGQEKEYVAEFMIGKTTPSFDLETNFDSETDYSSVSIEEIEKVLDQFHGEIEQVPPSFSAVKVDGVRAYKKARKNQNVEIKPRRVTIHEIDILEVKIPSVIVRIVCSKGTYIRSLANDFGKQLGVGAHLANLRRTRIGDFLVVDAKSINELQQQIVESS